MKKLIVVLLIGTCGIMYSQEKFKSQELRDNIRKLELEYNKLIIEQYLSEQTDTGTMIPIFGISQNVVTDFQNSHPDIKAMSDSYKQCIKYQDSIRNLDADFKKLLKVYQSSTMEEKKKMEPKFSPIYAKINRESPSFKASCEKSRLLRIKINYTILKRMLLEYQQRGELVPTTFIPLNDLRRYDNIFDIKDKKQRIEILKSIYPKVLEDEYRSQYLAKDSSKRNK